MLESAKNGTTNKFASAILKGTGPLLQKMMQGLPKDVMLGFADALADMKANLAPIPRKVVQAHLMKMIKDSNGKITSIELRKSLGAASVGEAFLCRFTYTKRVMKMKKNPDAHAQEEWIPDLDQNNQPQYEDVIENKDLVVKIMRHDAELRVNREAKLFNEAAKTIPGMEKTWKGQLDQYMTEFDFTTEANNTTVGRQLYAIKDTADHPLQAIAPEVTSMKISDLVPAQKNVLVAEVAQGSSVDAFFKKNTNEIRNAVSAVFKQDPVTHRVIWKDGIDPKTQKPKKVPEFQENIPATALANVKNWISVNHSEIQKAQDKLIQASKAWFHEALLGSGKFHGDAHSGNIMVSGNQATFIDFGNLFQLQKRDRRDKQGNLVMDPQTNQPVQLDERVELLRIVLGTTLRNSKTFLQGFESLLSPEGMKTLEANRDKAEAILSSILNKGKFSYDTAYRLQAAVVELQKLGLELPPQINCFILSMVRLQNTISEMNTILNQANALMEATESLVRPKQDRDELDLLGKAYDVAVSQEGKNLVPNPDDLFDAGAENITFYQQFLHSEEMGGNVPKNAPMFNKGGTYYNKLMERLTGAANPVTEAENLVNIIVDHTDREHNITDQGNLENLNLTLNNLRTRLAAAKTDQQKQEAYDDFCDSYCEILAMMISNLQIAEMYSVIFPRKTPATFASAVMGVLFESSDAVDQMLEQNFTEAERGTLKKDIVHIATSELNVSAGSLIGSIFGFGNGEQMIKDAIINDAKQMAGDDSYQIDIGV